jgi:Glycosyl hydrolase family 63 C-terminal domain
MPQPLVPDAETERLAEDARRQKNWKRWGAYLSERQWGTVREDYSANGTAWEYFPHDHARSRAYRWGEDGLLGLTDRECRICFSPVLWNEKDPILKERFFGLTNSEGNHGEDVKELYWYLDATPTGSYLKALYKYPQAAFPYAEFVEENRRRGRALPEFDPLDTGVFNDNRYFDVLVEYAKASADDIFIRLTATNRGPQRAPLQLLPTVWLRNTWAWGRTGEGYWSPGRIAARDGALALQHPSLGLWRLEAADVAGQTPNFIFCDNETNTERLYGTPGRSRWPKDSFHNYLVGGRHEAVKPTLVGTKAAAHYRFQLEPGESVQVRLRLSDMDLGVLADFGSTFDTVFSQRINEADAFYARRIPAASTPDQREVARAAYAGLIWNKQFYGYSVKAWLEGDPASPPPPPARAEGRNHDWTHLYNRDVISMPDKWEYPWFAAWDLGFHMVTFSEVDAAFAKEQLQLFLREWYTHPSGQLPAYEWAFEDANPPVHAWSCWRVYKKTAPRGARDTQFLRRVFPKLLINFTWWVNRKDVAGKHLFGGGFLGLDNVGVFDRNRPLPDGMQLAQADGTAWMAFACTTMLSISLELALEDPAYEDIASKFFEHFVTIVDAMNSGVGGLWDEQDGFYYDKIISAEGEMLPLRLRTMVGLIPLFAAEILEERYLEKLPGFAKRMHWFLENRPELASHISYRPASPGHPSGRHLLSVAPRERMERLLKYLVDEAEFLSPYGIRSLSKVYRDTPYVLKSHGAVAEVRYEPGESESGMFGGNSNWRGPVWFPLNFLLVEVLERYHHFYGDEFKIEFPTRSGQMRNLKDVAHLIAERLCGLFLPDAKGRRPSHGDEPRYQTDADFRNLVTFYEFFHGDTGKGLGAAHQTGWTALVVELLADVIAARNTK